MHPALSVILFTTVSGMGYGLWAWLGLRLLHAPQAMAAAPATWLPALWVGMVLTCAGIAASLFHLGKPLRVWRALSQWRSSWMSREGVMAMLTLLPAGALLAHAHGLADLGPALRLCGLLLAAGALGTVATSAMIYASLKPIPAWRHPLVVPGYVAFALLTGGLCALALQRDAPAPWMVWTVAGAGIALALLKIAYWRSVDRMQPMHTRGAAVGLPEREVTVFERPHTEHNFITREMAFVVARRHARMLRVLALLLFAVVPPLLLMLPPDALPLGAGIGLAALGAWAGAVLERWLFFAQARHVVTLYY